jgi:hypothetical protein
MLRNPQYDHAAQAAAKIVNDLLGHSRIKHASYQIV